ncbi:flagellar protein FlaG [Bacillus sp. SLBN-46]|uniref:flagellar protein FlaG n=1 Tax=Bacillus sp. SLBN-46 TaxID=3042283 RepID=UPI0028567420|nr:flagellar protein FlaG [Bacillus sp. SLBN-46]MDR6123767.1 flagellar protein FlaG [Bacillus sp. SLBN-46]
MLDKLSNSTSQLTDYKVPKVESTAKIKEILPETQQQPQQQPQPQAQTKEKTEKVMQSMNDFLKASNTHLKFQFHEELKEYYVTLVDDTTNEVVKEIPSKKLLDMYAAMTDYLGLLVDKKV